MSANPAFCKIPGIPAGERELKGSAIGYPKDELSLSIRPVRISRGGGSDIIIVKSLNAGAKISERYRSGSNKRN